MKPGFEEQDRRRIESVVVALEGRPGSRQRGGEITFRCVHPENHPNGDVHPSASFNASKGLWTCRACGAKGHAGDLLDLLGGATQQPVQHARVIPKPSRPKATSKPTQMIEAACYCGASHKRPASKASGCWFYHDADGEAVACALRFEKPPKPDDGPGAKPRKEFKPFDLAVGDWKFPDPRPLYRLDELARRPDEPVILVEGEKCADAVAGLGLLATSVMGGAQAVGKADLAPLAGRTVYLWRDNDHAGETWREKLRELLPAVGCTEVYVVPIPDGSADSWDAADAVAAGWDVDRVRELIGMAEAVEVEAPKPRRGEWRLWSPDELADVPPPKFVIEPIWLERGVSCIGGPSGHGKSIVALDLALRRATGAAFMGKPVEAGGVVYVAAEGFVGLSARVRAWFHHHRQPMDGVPFRILQAAPQLVTEDLGKLIRLIQEQPFPVRAVIVDTLSRTFVGKREANDEDMTRFADAVQQIADVIEGHVCVIHHTPVADDERLRGHSSLFASLDTVGMTSKLDEFVDVSCAKQKDDEPFAPFSYRVLSIQVPGSERTAPVGVPLSPEERNRRPDVLGEKASQVLGVLKAAGAAGLSFTDWGQNAGVPESTYKRAVRQLKAFGVIKQKGRKYLVAEGESGD